jgi:RNA polymerase sigma factor (sigma-70 family)
MEWCVGKQAKAQAQGGNGPIPQMELLYHFCRLHCRGVVLTPAQFSGHLQRAFELFRAKQTSEVGWSIYLQGLYLLDWFLAACCIEGDRQAWERLFAAHAGRSDCLLVDALRARALRLYPRDDERQESAVSEFWSHLLVPETPGAVPILARYDGQRPLVPWLIRVFQNWHISQLRHQSNMRQLPDDDVALPLPAEADGRWHEAFCLAAREALGELTDNELLILGLRLRYRMSQREVATLLGVHEGTISRQTSSLRDRCLDAIGRRLIEQGWAGDDLSGLVESEMGHLLLDEPRLSASRLASLLGQRGKALPAAADEAQ